MAIDSVVFGEPMRTYETSDGGVNIHQIGVTPVTLTPASDPAATLVYRAQHLTGDTINLNTFEGGAWSGKVLIAAEFWTPASNTISVVVNETPLTNIYPNVGENIVLPQNSRLLIHHDDGGAVISASLNALGFTLGSTGTNQPIWVHLVGGTP